MNIDQSLAPTILCATGGEFSVCKYHCTLCSFILETFEVDEVEEHAPSEAQRLFNGPLWSFSSVFYLSQLYILPGSHTTSKSLNPNRTNIV